MGIVFPIAIPCPCPWPCPPHRRQSNAASKDGDIPADVVVALMEMSDALHKGSYSLQVRTHTQLDGLCCVILCIHSAYMFVFGARAPTRCSHEPNLAGWLSRGRSYSLILSLFFARSFVYAHPLFVCFRFCCVRVVVDVFCFSTVAGRPSFLSKFCFVLCFAVSVALSL